MPPKRLRNRRSLISLQMDASLLVRGKALSTGTFPSQERGNTMTSDQSNAANEGSRKLTRKPVILAAAALIATSVLGLTLGNMVPFAAAETATQPTIETPYGRAPLSFADIVQKVTPAVVSINVKSDAKVAENDESEGDQVPGMPDLPKDSPLYDFFKQFRKKMPQQDEKPHPILAQGSGFFISRDGYIVTNNHVVEDAE